MPDAAKPVLLVIAGPNGSGKTTLVQALLARGVEIPNHLNADEIASGLPGSADDVAIQAQRVVVAQRKALLEAGEPISYETVMSHPSHIDFMRDAIGRGYEVHLYFIGTEDAAINIGRVADRVAKGGHDVPKDRTIARYRRVMRETLPAALAIATYAEFYDNSGEAPFAVARLRDGRLEMLTDRVPGWVERYLLPHAGDGRIVTLSPFRRR